MKLTKEHAHIMEHDGNCRICGLSWEVLSPQYQKDTKRLNAYAGGELALLKRMDALQSEIAALRVRPGHTVSQGDVKGESDATVNRLFDSLNSDAKDAEIAGLRESLTLANRVLLQQYEYSDADQEAMNIIQTALAQKRLGGKE